MFTARIFDREEQSRYEIYVKAHDHGIQSLSNTLNFTLIITDENDHSPIFDEEIYFINITETTRLNTTLIHFHATDADEENTLNSQIKYHLSNQTIFSLNSMTGELRLIGKIDREVKSTYELDMKLFKNDDISLINPEKNFVDLKFSLDGIQNVISKIRFVGNGFLQ